MAQIPALETIETPKAPVSSTLPEGRAAMPYTWVAAFPVKPSSQAGEPQDWVIG